MTASDRSTALAADARQAAYFHATLLIRQAQLFDTVAGRRPLIERGVTSTGSEARVRNLEAELKDVEKMLAGLERRFGAYWAINPETLVATQTS